MFLTYKYNDHYIIIELNLFYYNDNYDYYDHCLCHDEESTKTF